METRLIPISQVKMTMLGEKTMEIIQSNQLMSSLNLQDQRIIQLISMQERELCLPSLIRRNKNLTKVKMGNHR
jgi:uncharacterized protein YfeS